MKKRILSIIFTLIMVGSFFGVAKAFDQVKLSVSVEPKPFWQTINDFDFSTVNTYARY